MKFTVLLCTYNIDKESLKYTLDSIMNQQLDSYEIIVCDDASIENHEAFLKEYFAQKFFTDYKLVMNTTNKGTVKNLLSGLVKATGEYVKPIGAGDAIHDTKTLKMIYDFMKEKNARCVFTDLEMFVKDEDNRIDVVGIDIPLKKKDYLKTNAHKKMLENIIVYNDQISGASMFYETQYFFELLKCLESCVKYMEDLMQYLILLSGERIFYINKMCINYELGSGLSTLKNKSNNSKMSKDKNNFLNYLYEKYPDNQYVNRRKKIEEIDCLYGNKLLKGFMKFINEPRWLYFRVHRRK